MFSDVDLLWGTDKWSLCVSGRCVPFIVSGVVIYASFVIKSAVVGACMEVLPVLISSLVLRPFLCRI